MREVEVDMSNNKKDGAKSDQWLATSSPPDNHTFLTWQPRLPHLTDMLQC